MTIKTEFDKTPESVLEKEALAQQEQPAAVAYELEAVKFGNGKQLVYQKPKNLASYIKVRTLVYADADPAPTQPALSESQITSIAYNCNALPEVITDKTLVDFVRAIEAHCRGSAPTQPAQEPVSTDDMASAYLEKHLWKVIDMAGMWPKAKIDTRTWQHAMVYAPTQPALSNAEVTAKGQVAFGSAWNVIGAYYHKGFRDGEAHCRGGAS